MDVHSEKILVLDFGSQYTQLIARRIRENQVYCEIHPCNTPITVIRQFRPKGIILSGGPSSVYDKNAPECSPEILKLGIPVLGVCYGMQWMVHQMDGKVAKSQHREYGKADLLIDEARDLLKDVAGGRKTTVVWMSHGDRIDKLPPDFKVIGHTGNSPIAAIRHKKKPLFAIQFHPEVVHTENGTEVLKNFIFDVSGCKPAWTMKAYLVQAVEQIREEVGSGRVLCALSGGVDSAVAALMAQHAVGDQLTCVFVNNGLLRLEEEEKVIETFRKKFKLNLRYVDASREFLSALKGVTDPEKKRRIIGRKFIKVFEREAKELGLPEFLIQGTLYPDVIESVSFKGPSATIKTHHNVGGLPKRMRFKLVEPLRELFKDEVRRLGRELAMPDEVLYRHPFPGPGLAVRILGEVTRKRLDLLKAADAIMEEELRNSGWYRKIWQAFAVLLPVRTVGVMGDERTYENVIALRAVHSLDGMTADWVHIPHDLLGRMSNRIVNEVRGVNRVVYD
ncbi:MAG TPA: glutamine-hydrolyzing GMP synthase, partial [Nitrospiria bacterium]|nr:glutamine-hydrolyzing GMP synthase [Nitrospiria bacterium]